MKGRITMKKGFVILTDNNLYKYRGEDEMVTIPDGVTTIGEFAF